MVLKSQIYDDVYFSADGGMDETHHVFINGNNLPQAWLHTDRFTIAETGFGTGLNFLCAWKSFEEHAGPHQKLNFISMEKYPLSVDQIKDALSHWDDWLSPYLNQFLAAYPIRVPGVHEIDLTPRVRLTLWIGDINDVAPNWTGQVDAWFLDGFTPAKNPDMWGKSLFDTMARLSHSTTTYATFTAARFVRDGLEEAGFTVEKSKGFGRKRDMLKGSFLGHTLRQNHTDKKTVAIIGGGLAGCACAWQFGQAGHEVTLYERSDQLASGASGGRLGMINPKLTAKPTPHSDYYTACYANALRDLSKFNDIDFRIHGSLHLNTDEGKERRFKGYSENLGWHENHIKRTGDDLFYPDGASVSPAKLCAALATHANKKFNMTVNDLADIEADIIILANGYDCVDIASDLPVHPVRGQVSWVSKRDIETNICFGGYITPAVAEGFHILGSSFEPWQRSVEVTDENHRDNIERYNTYINNDTLTEGDIVGGWAALRASSKDRFSIVGRLRDNVYISAAHGSHGIISSLMAARILRANVDNEQIPASRDVLKALSPERFHKR